MNQAAATQGLPSAFEDEAHLEEVMTRPSAALVQDLAALEGDILVLGVGGKMGPTLARMAKRAAPHKRVIGVARFSEPGLKARLEAQGIECLEADLLSAQALDALPEVPNVIFMAGRKFGSQGSEWLTWAMNAHVPALVAQRFARSRLVVFSTACVYPFVQVDGPGAPETAPDSASDTPPACASADNAASPSISSAMCRSFRGRRRPSHPEARSRGRTSTLLSPFTRSITTRVREAISPPSVNSLRVFSNFSRWRS